MLLLGVFFFSLRCNEQEGSRLSIPEDRLIPLLTDIHLAEAYLQNLYGAQRDSVSEIYYQKIFEMHGVSREEFYGTMEILREDTRRAHEVYESVLEELSAQEAEIQ